MTIEILDGLDSLGGIHEEWMTLMPLDRWAVFSHPGWCKSVCESYSPDSRIRTYVAYDKGEVVGIIPTCSRRMNRYGLFLRVTECFGGGRGDYCVPLIKSNLRSEVFRRLLNAILETPGLGGAFVWPHMPDEWADEFEKCSAVVRRSFSKTTTACPICVFGESYEEMQRGWSAHLRNDLRRQRRRIEAKNGDISLRVVGSKREAVELLPKLFEMHDRRWLAANMPGLFSDDRSRGFYHNVVENLWGNGLHFTALYSGDTAIAYHFGFLSNGYLLFYKPTYDIDFGNYSPGKLLVGCLIEEGIKQGWTGIDFLQGAEGYKAMWATDKAETSSYVIRSSGLSPTYLWLTRGRPMAERKIGGVYRRVHAKLQSVTRKSR